MKIHVLFVYIKIYEYAWLNKTHFVRVVYAQTGSNGRVS